MTQLDEEDWQNYAELTQLDLFRDNQKSINARIELLETYLSLLRTIRDSDYEVHKLKRKHENIKQRKLRATGQTQRGKSQSL